MARDENGKVTAAEFRGEVLARLGTIDSRLEKLEDHWEQVQKNSIEIAKLKTNQKVIMWFLLALAVQAIAIGGKVIAGALKIQL